MRPLAAGEFLAHLDGWQRGIVLVNRSRVRRALRARRITLRIARRSVESRERLGRHRWVVERTLAWLNRVRRLKVRYERRADIHQAFLGLGCALICWNYLRALD